MTETDLREALRASSQSLKEINLVAGQDLNLLNPKINPPIPPNIVVLKRNRYYEGRG